MQMSAKHHVSLFETIYHLNLLTVTTQWQWTYVHVHMYKCIHP